MDDRKQDQNRRSWSCTTMIVGKKATVDGSVIVAHSDDDVTDERLIYVPAADHPPGSTRPVYYDDVSLGHNSTYNATEIRRYVGTSRGPGYNTNDFPDSVPLGEIPQSDHTYAYFDSNYGVMNEHQLMIGECTCGAKFHPAPDPEKRIFYASELSRVALERCTKAVDAVRLMGALIEQYGFYGTGETLLVGDPEEAWVMEMCGYEGAIGSKFDSKGTGGLWVAQRVPDDGFFVAANEFRIRTIVEGRDFDSEGLKYSTNLFEICKNQGWLSPSATQMDWLSTISWGEYGHPYYALRRVWRAFSKVAPSSDLPAWVESGYTTAYPFSLTPDKKLSIKDVISVYRDHYEGTEFDLTKGPGAGPFGDPTRYDINPDRGNKFNLNEYHPSGAWERSLSIYRCGMIWINQARSFLPDPIGGICWIGLDRPASTCLMPFYVGVSELPKSMETMSVIDFSRDSAWWAFNLVANYATIKYAYISKDIREKQTELEDAACSMLSDFEKGAEQRSRSELTSLCTKNTENVVSKWWRLFETLVVKYNDGCLTTANSIMQKVGYPQEWLDLAGYYKGPIAYRAKREFIKFSMCDMLKIGIGSSSSHTLAPWLSAQGCYQSIHGYLKDMKRINVELFGSLAFVGRGHYTTLGIPLGLLNKAPKTFDISKELQQTLGISDLTRIGELKSLRFGDGLTIDYNLKFNTKDDTKKEKMTFSFEYLDGSPSGQRPDTITYYSYGGGSYGTEPEPRPLYGELNQLPYMYKNSKELLSILKCGQALSQAIYENELHFADYRREHPADYPDLPKDKEGIFSYLKQIAAQMGKLIYDGCTYSDDDSCYKVMYASKKAKQMFNRLIGNDLDSSQIHDWISFMRQVIEKAGGFSFEKILNLTGAFALAVSEQNAALKNVVTAPTNGACGAVPAVLYYYLVSHATKEERDWLFGDGSVSELNGISRFLLTANAIGGIVKSNANIAGGLGGCQAEIGTAASMASGALTEILGGSPSQVFHAAELALENFLGSTCDPIGGLVEIPCIERNLTAAGVAIGTANEIVALEKDHQSVVPFDAVVATMENISNTMSPLYKETSTGGLAEVMRKDVEEKRPDLYPADREDGVPISVYCTHC